MRAYRIAGSITTYSNESGSVSAVTAFVAPALTATSAGYNSIRLSWTAGPGASGYEIYRSTQKSGAYSKVYTASASTTNWTQLGLITGKTYYYKVRAVHTSGSVTEYSGFSWIASARPVPSAPANVISGKYSSTSAKITWDAVAGASGYEVFRSTSPSSGFTRQKTRTSTYSGLAPGTPYYYKVRAYTLANGVKVYGAFSEIKSVTL